MTHSQPIEKPQLHMIWPTARRMDLLDPKTEKGYSIRVYQLGDEDAFLSLMEEGEFDPWGEEKLHYNTSRILPDGWFFAIEKSSQQIVGTAMCLHNYSGHTPFTGDVGWVACTTSHRGRGLGYSLTASVTNRFVQAGYTAIQLHTETYRLPAIKTYLKLGYLPLLDSPEIYALWQETCEQLGWTFTPKLWPHTM